MKIKNILIILFIVMLASCSNIVEKQFDLSKATIIISPTIKLPVNETAKNILLEEINKRTSIELTFTESWESKTILAIALTSDKKLFGEHLPSPQGSGSAELKKEGYRIFHENKNGKDILWIIGADTRGVLFGIGKLLKTADFAKGEITINNNLDISSSPEYKIRGQQFPQTAMNNTTDRWSIKQYETFIRNQVLFGMNTFRAVYPTEYNNAPNAISLSKMSELCAKYDVDFTLFTPAPYLSKKGVGEKRIKAFEGQVKKIPRLDAVMVPGGDPGSNEPQDLIPYVKDLATMVYKHFPNAEIWFSTQEFTDDKLQYIVNYLNENKPQWLTGIVYGPHTLWPVKKHREKLSEQFKILLYPDIGHSLTCQYPVDNWDQAFAITLGREGINPRPQAYTKIALSTLPYSEGFVAYSEGVHDDVNKHLWLQLAWDSNTDVKTNMEEYAKFYFNLDERNNKKTAQAILGLEKDWVGAIKNNKDIENTFRLWQELEKENPELQNNWRWQQLLMRAYYDIYNKKRFIYEKKIETEANKILADVVKLGSKKAIKDALLILSKAEKNLVNRDYRAKVLHYADMLFKSIGAQTSVGKYGGQQGRGTIIDRIDVPLNNRRWLEDQFEETKKLKNEKSRISKLKFLAAYSQENEGHLYDDLGNVTSKHDVTKPTTALKYLANGEIHNRKRLSDLTVSPTFETKLRYTNLDSKSAYIIRLKGKGKAFLKANGTRLNQLYSAELEIVPETMFVQKDGVTPGLKAYYWNNKELKGQPAAHQTDKAINHIWDYGESPMKGVNDNGFSARWVGKLKSPGTGLYGISIEADNGAKLFINGKLVFDAWEIVAGSSKSVFYEFKKNELYDIKVEFYENAGTCRVLFSMSKNPVKDISKYENYGTEYGQYKEFLIPKSLIKKRTLNISFDPIEGEEPLKGFQVISRISDVWLIKQN